MSLECGNLSVLIRDDCDQEVHKHDHAEELVQEPDSPNESHHKFTYLSCVIAFQLSCVKVWVVP